MDYEYVVKPNQKNEIRMRRDSDVLYFLQNIRDESHRFAIEFQRKLKRKHTLHSKIDDVPGIGPKRRRILLNHFGSLTGLKQASTDEILQVPEFRKTCHGNSESPQSIKYFLNPYKNIFDKKCNQ